MNGTDTNCSGTPTPWGTWLSCEETVVGRRVRLGQAARLHLRGGPERDRSEEAQAAQGDGALRPRGGRGRRAHRRRLHDRGRQPGRVLPVHPEGAGHARRRAGASQMLGIKGEPRYGTITGQTVGDMLPVELDRHRRPGPGEHRGRRDRRVPAGPGQGRRQVPVRRGLHVPQRRRSCSTPRTAATPGSVRSGSTRRRRTSARPTRRASSSCCSSRPDKLGVLDGPDNMCTTPGGAIVIVEDGNDRTNFIRGAPARRLDVHRWRRTWSRCGCSCIDASGKTYDPKVPERRPRHRRRARRVGVRRSAVQPRRQVAVREHPGSRHHVRDHRPVGLVGALSLGR